MPSTSGPSENVLLQVFEQRLEQCGDTAQGAWWPNEADRRTRFEVMLDVIEKDAPGPITVCDLGCGTGELLGYIRERGLTNISYVGVDRSPLALQYARSKFPDATFLQLDVNDPAADLDLIECDYLVANGLFTAKFSLSYEKMWSFLVSTVDHVWPKVRRGLALNVMSKVVDWERDDLFHVPMDDAARLFHRLAGRRVRFRADYGLYEYTVYAYRPESQSSRIQVLHPKLPSADRLLPYLRRIDRSRIYSNHGPLSNEFERRTEAHLGLPGGAFASASSGTAALTGAVLAVAGRAQAQRPYALIPAFTFVATASAVEQCGYQPYLVDVNPDTWTLDPERLRENPALGQTGVVIPVSPFGRPVCQEAWLRFQEDTGVPVVIDGAAAFDRVLAAPGPFLGPIPTVFSFHATKGFAAGEGGGVASTDLALIPKVVQALNFGFRRQRNAESTGFNGKMTEYHAAVGLAEFDNWHEKQAALSGVVACYRRLLSAIGLSGRFVAAPDVGLSYALFRCRTSREARHVAAELERQGVDTRLWYGAGLHRQRYFSSAVRDNLKTTDRIAPCLLGLPMAPDLTEARIARIVATLGSSLQIRSEPAERTRH